jgi:lipoprotein NlpD
LRRWAAAVALALAACPAPRPAFRPLPLPLAPAEQHDEPALAGVVHVVKRGETVYRIARAYAIDPADLMETNGIADPRNVAVGMDLFVPGAPRTLDVPPAPVPGDPAAATASATSHSTTTATAPPHSTPTATSISTPTATATTHSTPTRVAIATPTPPRASADDAVLAWPLKGVLYGRYGVRAGRRHDGIDIAAPEGTVVGAAAAGTVIFAGEQSGYGSIVIVKHDGGLVTLYAHASRVLVREGERVKRGDPVAKVGQTGRTTGPHLHFEVRDGTRPRNPLLFLP